jgi:hypothetical protein
MAEEGIQPALTPEILPPQETPEMYGPVDEGQPAAAPMAKANPMDIVKKFTPFIAIFFILLIILVVSSLVAKPTPVTTPAQVVTPTPTAGSTVISTRSLSFFATESAFIQFDAIIEKLPRDIQGAVLQDPTALPPVLDLPLGFTN